MIEKQDCVVEDNDNLLWLKSQAWGKKINKKMQTPGMKW